MTRFKGGRERPPCFLAISFDLGELGGEGAFGGGWDRLLQALAQEFQHGAFPHLLQPQFLPYQLEPPFAGGSEPPGDNARAGHAAYHGNAKEEILYVFQQRQQIDRAVIEVVQGGAGAVQAVSHEEESRQGGHLLADVQDDIITGVYQLEFLKPYLLLHHFHKLLGQSQALNQEFCQFHNRLRYYSRNHFHARPELTGIVRHCSSLRGGEHFYCSG